MNLNEVIKHPILTEKTYSQMSQGVYTFAVDFRTNKAEVKRVVEHIFEVKVEKVNIMTVDKKAAKLGRFQGFKNRYKKAIVTLADGQINLFPEDAVQEPETKVEVKTKAEVTKEMSEAEKKAAAKIAAKKAEKEATTTEAKTETKEVEVKAEETK